MSLEEIARRVETQVFAISTRLWPRDRRMEWRDELERLGNELNQHASRAAHYRDVVAFLRARIAENEVREAVLASRIETYVHIQDQTTAYRDALQLDEIRRQLADDRARLPGEAKAQRFHQARAAALEQRMAELEDKLRLAAAR
jgi:hypothetical protein